MEEMLHVFLFAFFSLLLIFLSRYKILMFLFQRNSSPLFFISRSSSFSVIPVIVDGKIQSQKRLGVVVAFSL